MRRIVGLLVVLLVLGCADGLTSPQDTDLESDFTVTVTPGITPTISWDGGNAGSVAVVDVTRASSSLDYSWEFFADDVETGIPSPITYGAFPANSVCDDDFGPTAGFCPVAKPLVKGHRYLVVVSRTDFQTGVVEISP